MSADAFARLNETVETTQSGRRALTDRRRRAIRLTSGLDAAQAVGGHFRVETAQVCAEASPQKAIAAMEQGG